MRCPGTLEIGACTHTGRVRSANEDDFLICAPPTPRAASAVGWVVALADGMGGAAGGAEASRTAVRAVVRPFLDLIDEVEGREDRPAFAEPEGLARMRTGFAAAASQVHALSKDSPHLQEMGTTLTVINLVGPCLVLGHVGDTRCALLRRDSWLQLTEDHAVVGPPSYLTRCVGAGMEAVEADVLAVDVEAGDRLVLMSDGLWGVVDPAKIAAVVGGRPPQTAAEELVRLANRAGGPDNATVVVLAIRTVDLAPEEEWLRVDLPTEEPTQPLADRFLGRDLMPPRWPLWLLILGILALILGLLRLFFQIDLIARLQAWLGAI